MSALCADLPTFNENIGQWNTSSVTDMRHMFRNAHKFNHPIGGWNTTAVSDMSGMFIHAFAFNQPIGSWNTTSVKDMHLMFRLARVFDQPIGLWRVGCVLSNAFHFTLLETSVNENPDALETNSFCKAGYSSNIQGTRQA